MPTSLREDLERDLACEDLLDCVYGLGDCARACYRVLTNADEPLTVDAVADRVDRDRTTAYRALTRLEAVDMVEQRQVNYEQGGYYFVYEAVDADEVAREMQRTLNEWYATIGTLIGEFEAHLDGDRDRTTHRMHHFRS